MILIFVVKIVIMFVEAILKARRHLEYQVAKNACGNFALRFGLKLSVLSIPVLD
jgi:hypothetical protein